MCCLVQQVNHLDKTSALLLQDSSYNQKKEDLSRFVEMKQKLTLYIDAMNINGEREQPWYMEVKNDK